jgi:hypothetical protein
MTSHHVLFPPFPFVATCTFRCHAHTAQRLPVDERIWRARESYDYVRLLDVIMANTSAPYIVIFEDDLRIGLVVDVAVVC